MNEPTQQEVLEEMVAAVAYLAKLVAKIRGDDAIIDAIIDALQGEELVRATEQRLADSIRYRNAVSDEAVKEARRVTGRSERPTKKPKA